MIRPWRCSVAVLPHSTPQGIDGDSLVDAFITYTIHDTAEEYGGGYKEKSREFIIERKQISHSVEKDGGDTNPGITLSHFF